MGKLLTVTASLAMLAVMAAPAGAAYFVVDSTLGDYDVAPGDGICATSSGSCTFRAAVQEANALDGADAIIVPAGSYAIADLRVTDDLVIGGAGAEETVIDGVQSDTTVESEADLALLELTITGGNGANVGGGIRQQGHHLTLINCAVRDNWATNVGGGIYNDRGVLTIIGSTISGNEVMNVGGGVHSDGALYMVGSTVRDNHAWNVGGGVSVEGRATIENSTISGNRVINVGGGLYNRGTLHVRSSTITLNGAGNTPGAGIDASTEVATHLSLDNTIVANNRQLQLQWSDPQQPPELVDIGPAVDCDSVGIPIAGSYNLIGWRGTTCLLSPTDNLFDMSADLGPLQNNGGPTFTHALLAGSAAIDTASPATPGSGAGACPVDDQRGIVRPYGLGCDVGAFELSPCGDGNLDSGEECDDANGIDGDGCDSNCTLTACGNGVTTDGEQCDDGNLEDGDCCSSACELTIDDDLLPAGSATSKVLLKERSSGLLKWTWKSDAGITPDDFGDPTDSTDYTLCLVDEAGTTPRLLLSAKARSGGICDGRPCWRRNRSGFRFKGDLAGSGRVGKLRLSAGTSGARIALKGKGKRLRLGRLPLVLPLRVVLRKSDGSGSFSASFSGPRRNALDQFKAISD